LEPKREEFAPVTEESQEATSNAPGMRPPDQLVLRLRLFVLSSLVRMAATTETGDPTRAAASRARRIGLVANLGFIGK
jgi:hypothetical protein